jgi:hypothetical protein
MQAVPSMIHTPRKLLLCMNAFTAGRLCRSGRCYARNGWGPGDACQAAVSQWLELWMWMVDLEWTCASRVFVGEMSCNDLMMQVPHPSRLSLILLGRAFAQNGALVRKLDYHLTPGSTHSNTYVDPVPSYNI